MITVAALAAILLLAGFAGWRLHRLTTPPAPTPSVRMRRTTIHEDWDITGTTPPAPVLDRTYASPTWGLPELENR